MCVFPDWQPCLEIQTTPDVVHVRSCLPLNLFAKHSLTLFKGTNECEYHVHEYNETIFDTTLIVDVKGFDKQVLPSPPEMTPYKEVPVNHLSGTFIVKHPSMSSITAPDPTSERLCRYGRVFHLTYMNTILGRVVSYLTGSYLETPVAIYTDMFGLRDEVMSDCGNCFFRSNNKFQEKATNKYITLSITK